MSKRLLIILTVFMVCFGISGAGVCAAPATAGTASSAAAKGTASSAVAKGAGSSAAAAASAGAPNDIRQPVLTKLTFTKKNKKAVAVLKWTGMKRGTFRIYRKLPGKRYKAVKTITLKGSNGTFTDKNLNPRKSYIYTVEQRTRWLTGPRDEAGIRTLPAPTVKVRFTNMKARVSWNKVKGADSYTVYRKCFNFWEPVATTSSRTYTDWYRNLDDATLSANRITYREFIDPAYNKLAYTVRATSTKSVEGQKKCSVGARLPDGDFYLEQPTVISADCIAPEGSGSADLDSGGADPAAGSGDASVRTASAPAERLLTWGAVPHAKAYRILIKRSGSWKVYRDVKGSPVASVLTAKVPANGTHYGVRAIAKKNGRTVKSDYEKNFSVSMEGHGDQSILFIGDSIIKGNPYICDDDADIYTIPWRVGALTGAKVMNRGKGGACLHDHPITETYIRRSLYTHVLSSIKLNKLAGYDVVVLEGGTNDYYTGAQLGEVNGDSSRDTGTVCGAFNSMIDLLEEANAVRAESGLPPMKVVLFDITFSNRVSSHILKHNRDTTQDSLGLTLRDYQRALNNVWQTRASSSDPFCGLQFYHYRTRSYGILKKSNCDLWSSDNLHPTKKAYAEYGSSLAQFMIENNILN